LTANGQLQVVEKENDLINARVIVVGVKEINSGSFDVTTGEGVGSNRP